MFKQSLHEQISKKLTHNEMSLVLDAPQESRIFALFWKAMFADTGVDVLCTLTAEFLIGTT